MKARAAKSLSVPMLVAALAASGAAAAQTYGAPYGAPVADRVVTNGGYYDFARVIRVVPVVGAPEGYPAAGQRCTTRQDAYGGYVRDDGRQDGSRLPPGDYYGPDGRYYSGGEAPPRSAPANGRGTEGGRTMASVLGTVIGAVVGSQVGGGSARYATAAVGSAVGGIAGRQVYDNAHRDDGYGNVTVCDPVDAGRAYPAAGRNLYDVTYEYGGRTYMARTTYDPGERLRVRVDVHPE
jgi:hypothetical protein